MPFRIRHRPSKGDQEPELVPTPVCDYCGEPIAHVRDDVWLIAPDQYETKDGPVLVAHHDRSDDRGDPVVRCHTKLDWRENQAGRHTPGWLELGRLIAALIVQYPGARQRAGEALDLDERDVWLLRWLAAEMPVEGLHGQPKQWDFELADAAPLADRIAASVRMRTPTEAVDDDMRYSQAGQDLRDAYKDRPPPLEEDDEEHPF